MQQISLGAFVEWEKSVYFCPLFVLFKTQLTHFTHSTMSIYMGGRGCFSKNCRWVLFPCRSRVPDKFCPTYIVTLCSLASNLEPILASRKNNATKWSISAPFQTAANQSLSLKVSTFLHCSRALQKVCSFVKQDSSAHKSTHMAHTLADCIVL